MNYFVCRPVEPNIVIRRWWGDDGSNNPIVGLYAKANKGKKQPSGQIHGRLVNKKWAVSHKPANRVSKPHAHW
jgi:hypothetical protein